MLPMPKTNANDDLPLASSSPIVVVPLSTVPRRNLLLLLALLRAEFLAAVLCAKIALYLRSILFELGFPCKGPTRIYEDNASTIDIVNSTIPTERARHIYIQYFAIQDWKEWGCIKLIHIPGKINPPMT